VEVADTADAVEVLVRTDAIEEDIIASVAVLEADFRRENKYIL
jgi:hypothetical protein